MEEGTTNQEPQLVPATSKRLCWVCFGTDLDDENEDVVWISPCQCRGTMKWVHEECLQIWIDEKQKRTSSMRVLCSQCKTHYILSFPPVNGLIRLIEQYDKLLYGSSPFVAISVVVGSIYWCCGSYGFISIIQVIGYEEARRILDEADPLLLVIGLPVIPIALISAKLIKWEDFILKLWRQSANSLPRPLSYIIDKPPVKPRANCDQLLMDPGFNEPLGCTRMICGALLLPTISSLIGKIFFSKLTGSQWRRSLVGGLAFLLIKGAMKIYFRKSQYIRYSQRSIKDYVPKRTGPSGTSLVSAEGEAMSASDYDSVLNDDDQGEVVRLQSDDDDNLSEATDDSDDEEQIPRTRTMFSMTISLGR